MSPAKTDSARGRARAERAEMERLALEARSRILQRSRLVLTPELIEEIIIGVGFGNYPEVVAASLGVNEHTFRQWMSEGESRWMEGQQNPAEYVTRHDPYGLRVELYLAVKQAEAAWETGTVEAMTQVIESGSKWPGHMTMLQRRYPARWGIRDVSNGNGSGFEAAVREFDAQRRKQQPA